MPVCFPMQNFTEIGQSVAELCMAKETIFKMAAVRHLEFGKLAVV